jgi:hypothetical protein
VEVAGDPPGDDPEEVEPELAGAALAEPEPEVEPLPEAPDPEPAVTGSPELEPEVAAKPAAAPAPDPDPELHAAPRTMRQGAEIASARNPTAMGPLAVDCASKRKLA